ncbi:MAG: hypothetical protein ACOYOM_14250, partial [Chloroflexota bacterium]
RHPTTTPPDLHALRHPTTPQPDLLALRHPTTTPPDLHALRHPTTTPPDLHALRDRAIASKARVRSGCDGERSEGCPRALGLRQSIPTPLSDYPADRTVPDPELLRSRGPSEA